MQARNYSGSQTNSFSFFPSQKRDSHQVNSRHTLKALSHVALQFKGLQSHFPWELNMPNEPPRQELATNLGYSGKVLLGK
jgi:hypothetical protein